VSSTTIVDSARTLFLSDELPEEFAWVDLLTPRHMRLFAVELNAALASPSTEALNELLDGWKATAELDAVPELQKQINQRRSSTGFRSVSEWPNQRTA
jgi:hypothetical protein